MSTMKFKAVGLILLDNGLRSLPMSVVTDQAKRVMEVAGRQASIAGLRRIESERNATFRAVMSETFRRIRYVTGSGDVLHYNDTEDMRDIKHIAATVEAEALSHHIKAEIALARRLSEKAAERAAYQQYRTQLETDGWREGVTSIPAFAIPGGVRASRVDLVHA